MCPRNKPILVMMPGRLNISTVLQKHQNLPANTVGLNYSHSLLLHV